MRYIYQSIHNHAGGWLQSGCSEKKLKRYAEFQNMEIVNEYSDEVKSGKSVEGRPEFQRMLDNIENGTDEVQFVLVFKLSRFGRNAADVINSLQRMKLKLFV